MLVRASQLVPSVVILTGVFLAACSSDVARPGHGGAGQGGDDPGSGGAAQGGDDPGGGGGASGTCDSADLACVCAACEADGGVCGATCNDPPSVACEPKAPLGPQDFSCGDGFCRQGNACVEVLPPGDGCSYLTCVELPVSCVDDPTCGCIEEAATVSLTCRDDAGGPSVTTSDPATPWVAACGGRTCLPSEACWSCRPDGGMGVEPTARRCYPIDDPPGGNCSLQS